MLDNMYMYQVGKASVYSLLHEPVGPVVIPYMFTSQMRKEHTVWGFSNCNQHIGKSQMAKFQWFWHDLE